MRISGPNYVGASYEASGTGDDPWTQPAVSPTNAGTTVFTVPTNTGGSPITHYIATASPGEIISGEIASVEDNAHSEGHTTGTSGDQNSLVTNGVYIEIRVGDLLRIIDKPGQTCAVTPLGVDLTVSSVLHGERRSMVQFSTDITATDASASANCIFTKNSVVAMAYAAAVASIDDGANTVTLSAAERAIIAGSTLKLADRGGSTDSAIAAAAVASIDAGTANTVTLGSPDSTIAAGQTLQLADAGGQTCLATPKTTDLVVARVSGAVITFTTDITLGDTGASTNCVITRAAPCAATPKGSTLVVSTVSSTTITFSTDITAGDAAAAASCVLKPADHTIVVPGLENGVAYTFTTVAKSAVGYSDHTVHGGVPGQQRGNASLASSPTTPGKVPDPPRITGLASEGSAQATVSFAPPVDSGGASIVLYTVTASPGGVTETGARSPITVTGLTNGVEYSFSVTAHNHWGESSAGTVSTYGPTGALLSGSVTGSGSCCCDSSTLPVGDGSREDCLGSGLRWYTTITPSTLPDPPTVTAVSPTHGGALVTFDAPTDNGGVAVTSYTLSAIKGRTATGGDIGLVTAVGTASPMEITGLDSGTPYTVTLTASNAKGTSDPAWSSSADAAAIAAAALSSIDATANSVVLSSGDTTIVAGQKLRLLDRSGTTASAIADAAIASIDAGTANSITLSSPDNRCRATSTARRRRGQYLCCDAKGKRPDCACCARRGDYLHNGPHGRRC